MKEHLKEEVGVEIRDLCGNPLCVFAAIIHSPKLPTTSDRTMELGFTGDRENTCIISFLLLVGWD
jgi:hypothetical protein